MKKVIILVPIVMVLAGGFWLYESVFAPTQEASGPTVAKTLDNAPAGLKKFRIDSQKSTTRFQLSEILNGRPTEVIGTTQEVAGEVGLDMADLSSMKIGEIQINARTLKTDSDMRNRMIGNQILSTGESEFIKFMPSQISGLNGGATKGSKTPFTITGNLTIRQTSKPVTFDATFEMLSPTSFQVIAHSTVNHADFGIQIPRVPSVAEVSKEVRLEIDAVVEAAP